MLRTHLPELKAGGATLDTGRDKFGELRRSHDVLLDTAEIQSRFEQDGYLYIPGFFNRDDVMAVRIGIAERLKEEGALDPNFATEACIAKQGLSMVFRPDIANSDDRLQRLIYSDSVMEFYSRLLGGPAIHYDFTWMRVVAPGFGTWPHADVVYMGRGTHNVCTAWIPFGDVPLSVGGLIILEGSHKRTDILGEYWSLDVDAMCENKPGKNTVEAAGFQSTGAIDLDFVGLQNKFGGRWLTAEFEMGDLLTFSVYTAHGSLDNGSNQIRISSDSRYQLASEPIDERWVGENPIAHGLGSKTSLIC